MYLFLSIFKLIPVKFCFITAVPSIEDYLRWLIVSQVVKETFRGILRNILFFLDLLLLVTPVLLCMENTFADCNTVTTQQWSPLHYSNLQMRSYSKILEVASLFPLLPSMIHTFLFVWITISLPCSIYC